MSSTDILQHRKAQATLTLIQRNGQALSNQEITLAQTNHKFLFGAAPGSPSVALVNEKLHGDEKTRFTRVARNIRELCNAVTLPFYWGRFEPEQGRPATQALRNTAQWWVEQGCVVKGHPLCWHTVCADWLLEMSNEDILSTQIARIKREVADFKGLIDMWDVINEAVIMPIFEKYDNGITRICKDLGRINTVRIMFEAARAENPGAVLLLNDFDMSAAYPILIEGCLEAGIQIDAIGIQSHMHQGYWGVEKTLKILDQFSQFKLPIHFTETNIVSGELMPAHIVDLNDYQMDEWPSTPEGEERQAREAVQHYRTLFAHPAVEALTWWDFVDNGWLNAPAGLVRTGGSPKPAYDELLNLIKREWWTPATTLQTDAEGKIRFNGFLGEYDVSWQGNTTTLTLDSAEPCSVTLRF